MREVDTTRGRVTIRTARATEAQALRALRLEAITQHPTSFSQTPAEIDVLNWTEMAERGDGEHDVVFVAVAGEEFAGLTGAFRGKKVKEQHRAGIWGVYVRAEWRGLRIGEALLEAAVDWAKRREAKIVHLMVNTTNTSAIACYHRCGFRISGQERASLCIDGKYHDEFLMYRWLDGEQ